MKPYLAFSPGSISTIFSPYFDNDILKTGSLGLSFTIDQGVFCDIQVSEDEGTFFNNRHMHISAVDYVAHALAPSPVSIYFRTSLPIGSGFGVSAACALSCAFALNRFFDLGQSEEELLKIAHAADALSRTGLSDVITQYTGGVILRYKKNHPFVVKSLPGFHNQSLCAYLVDTIETKKVLQNESLLSRIQQVGDSIVATIDQHGFDSIDSLIRASYIFSQESTLLKEAGLKEILEKINSKNVEASMIMLGKAFFSTQVFPDFHCIPIKMSDERTRYL